MLASAALAYRRKHVVASYKIANKRRHLYSLFKPRVPHILGIGKIN